jgi:hypothetical protein
MSGRPARRRQHQENPAQTKGEEKQVLKDAKNKNQKKKSG